MSKKREGLDRFTTTRRILSDCVSYPHLQQRLFIPLRGERVLVPPPHVPGAVGGVRVPGAVGVQALVGDAGLAGAGGDVILGLQVIPELPPRQKHSLEVEYWLTALLLLLS